jgi:hypothetical protein
LTPWGDTYSDCSIGRGLTGITWDKLASSRLSSKIEGAYTHFGGVVGILVWNEVTWASTRLELLVVSILGVVTFQWP